MRKQPPASKKQRHRPESGASDARVSKRQGKPRSELQPMATRQHKGSRARHPEQ